MTSAKTSRPIRARFRGRCAACSSVIRPGSEVTRVPAVPGWLHIGDCVEAVEALIRSKAWRRCGAYTQAGHPCRVWVVNEDGVRCVHHQQ
jgi:hypothetical protein